MHMLMENQAYLHTFDRRGRNNTDWSLYHHQYVNSWMAWHNTVVGGTPASDTRYPSAEYMRWYREMTVLYICNPSCRPAQPEGYQGDGSRVDYTFDMVLRMHNMSIDNLPAAEPAAAAVWTVIRDMTYETLRGAGELDRLSCRPPDLLVSRAEDHIQARPVHIAPRNVRGSQHGSGRRRRARPTDPTYWDASQSHNYGKGPSQPHSYDVSHRYDHSEGPSQPHNYDVSHIYDHGEGPSQPTSYAEGPSQSPITPPFYIQTQVSSIFPFGDPGTIQASTTGISTSPVPFAGFTSHSEDIAQTYEFHHDAEVIPHRTRRIRRPTGSGTHGTLGPH